LGERSGETGPPSSRDVLAPLADSTVAPGLVRRAAWARAGPAATAAVLTLVAAAFALLFLGRESFGHDEGASIVIARSNWGDLWHVVAVREANMGLYYVLLHFWLALGNAEVTVRLLSVLPAALAVPTVYAIGRRVVGERCGVIAAVFLACNAFFVYYAQEARSYALVVFLVTLATLLFFIAVEEKRSAGMWVAYMVIASLAVYAHFFALFVITAHAVAFALRGRTPHSSRRSGFLAFSGIGALVSPLIFFIFTRNSGQLNWLDRPGLRDIVTETLALAGGSRILALVYFLAVASAAWTFGRRWRARSSQSFRDVLVVGWLLLPIGGSLLVSVVSPIFIAQYLIVALPALALVGAIGVTEVPWRLGGLVLGIALVVLSVASVARLYEQKDKEDWRSAGAYLAANASPTDGIIVYTMPARAPLEAYVVKDNLARRMPRPLYPSGSWGAFSLLGPRTPDIARLSASLRRFRRVWLVLSHDQIDSGRRRSSNALQALLSNRPRVEERLFAGPIRVRLYGEPRPD
jgi:mannosyltransferase